jgi:TonB family protein
MRIPTSVVCVVLFCVAVGGLRASDDGKRLDKLLEEASKKTSLIAPGSAPFHLKLAATETRRNDPQFQAEIEMWWMAPDKWHREVKSPAFSQTAIQNGQRYYENNSSDYMPFWLYELIHLATDPIPVEALQDELKGEEAELRPRRGCQLSDVAAATESIQAEWQTNFTVEGEQIDKHNEICFNSDGTVGKLFTRPVSAQLENYQKFQGKWSAGLVVVWPGGPTEVRGTVLILEKLKPEDASFAIPKDTGLASRLRFLSVPQSAMESYTLDTPVVEWPVLHNFPTSGAVTIDVKIDRNGTIREMGSPLSRNVIINDALKAQIGGWKFKPYPNAEAPVQVDTNITLRWESKVELLGGNGKTTSINFFERIAKAKELSDPRTPGSKPFHLEASFETDQGTAGKYEEVWVSPEKWWRHVELGSITVVKTRSGEGLYTQIMDSPFTPKRIDEFLDGLDVPFPDTGGSFIEQDWGHSAVTFDGLDMVRVARGRVNDKNEPIDGQAYWFDSAGLLHAAYWDPRMISYGQWAEWNGKQVPRRIELSINNARAILTTIERIEAPSVIDDTLFVLKDVKPTSIDDSDDEGPPIVKPEVIYRVQAVAPASQHGTVVVTIQLDQHGHVVGAKVKQSAGPELDDAALKSVMEWEFTPMRIHGRAVPGSAAITFHF